MGGSAKYRSNDKNSKTIGNTVIIIIINVSFDDGENHGSPVRAVRGIYTVVIAAARTEIVESDVF